MPLEISRSNAIRVATSYDVRVWNSNAAMAIPLDISTCNVLQNSASVLSISSTIGGGYLSYVSNVNPSSSNMYPPSASYSSNYTNVTTTAYGNGPYTFLASFIPSQANQYAYNIFTQTGGAGMRTQGVTTSGTATSNSISYRPYSLYTSTIASGTEIYGVWVQVKLPQPVVINKYTVVSASEYDAVTFGSLVASSNNLDWTHLHTYLRTWTTATDVNLTIPFSFSNSTPFQYYRYIARGTSTTGINQSTIVPPFVRLYSVGTITSNVLTTAPVRPNITLDAGYTVINGYVGLGVNPPLMPLHMAYDGARKLSTASWDIGSDYRLKTDIIEADYERCYTAFSNLPLKYFTWRNDIPELASIKDRRKLGWIAQDVQNVFPHAVTTVPEQYGIDNLLVMNPDQIYALMYGAMRHLVKEVDDMKQKIDVLQSVMSL